MEWILSIGKAVAFMERNMTAEMKSEDVSAAVFASHAHFQRLFHLTTGITIGEYIRNRRLSLAGQELLLTGGKVVDVAMKYQYDTAESFSKAFSRFHGITPSQVKSKGHQLRFFYPLSIHLCVEGGFQMTHPLIEAFSWSSAGEDGAEMTAAEKYKSVVQWTGKARGQNPMVFDELTKWIWDDAQWNKDSLAENEQIFMQGILARFKGQNARLRSYLKALEPAGVVNAAVFPALDRFDEALSGRVADGQLHKAVTRVFADFSAMQDPAVRKQIAGGVTGPTGTDSTEVFGYVNCLKECDAAVQWALFMPEKVKEQQRGFVVVSFQYMSRPAMRFIGFEGEEYADAELRAEKMKALDAWAQYGCEPKGDVLLMHHNGLNVDVGAWRGLWGRFMQAEAPIPDGFLSIDFVPRSNGKPGAPYLSQFAYAAFSGDAQAMHRREGYDVDAMYDVTRNIILGQGVAIPYPEKYWTAELFPDGCDKQSTGYLFSVEL
ncbi:MAG: helix-turn-helix transcriptional regulator [Eubacteriales bacterium]|nr:helix-turn-helix transcriptional regulator [Eubacteriales bacterium]